MNEITMDSKRSNGRPRRDGRIILRLLPALCLFALLPSANASAQDARVTLAADNEPLKNVLEHVQLATPYRFTYRDIHLPADKAVTVRAENMVIEAFLGRVLAGTGLTWNRSGNTFVIIPKEERKEIAVKGTVVDENNLPMPGVAVVVRESGKGTATDNAGQFALSAYPDATLVFTYLGYQTQEMKPGGRGQITVHLQPEATNIDEVVVVGYGTQDKKTLTGSVSVVKMDDISTSSKSTIAQALAGQAAGFRVTQNSAQAGGGATFRIRGALSRQSSNDPLFVIDGIPVTSTSEIWGGHSYSAGSTDNYLESLNPEDIESITVLKDAASTAIYGSRAGHGVVLVTTKRGTDGQARINYSGSVSVQTIAKQFEMVDGPDYMRVINNYNYEKFLFDNGLSVYAGYSPARDPGNPPLTIDQYQPEYTDEMIASAPTTDWLGQVMRTGILHQHNLSMRGGSDKFRYLISGNYMDQKGVLKNNATKRFTARANLDVDLNRYFTTGITAMFSRNSYENSQVGSDGEYDSEGIIRSAAMFNPYLPVRDSEGKYTIDPARSTSPNPVSLLEITDNTVKNRIMGSVFLAAKPVKGLEIKLNLGGDLNIQKRGSYLPTTTKKGLEDHGRGTIVNMDDFVALVEVTATYSASFAEKHNLKVLAGHSYQSTDNEWSSAANRYFSMEAFKHHNLTLGTDPIVGSGKSNRQIESFFGRVNYDYKQKYLFEATLRADASSNFTPENRWGLFPSVAVGWVVSEEKFMEPARHWLSNLKIRASFGETGNAWIGNYTVSSFQVMPWTGYAYMLGGKMVNGMYSSIIGNPDITWETTRELNIGLDVGFLNNRISLSAEYYNRIIYDLLDVQPLMHYYEVSNIWGNMGSTKGTGVEITINSTNINNRNFNWSTSLTMGHYTDRWRERSPYWKPKQYEKANDYMRPVFAYEAMGIMQPGDVVPRHQTGAIPGVVLLRNQNPGDPTDNDGNETGRNWELGDEDIVMQGCSDPDLTFGFQNNFRWKNLELNIYFYGEFGMTKGGSYLEEWAQTYNRRNVTTAAFDTWAHNNRSASRPSLLSGGTSKGNWDIREIYFVRCGNIRLGYNIPVNRRVFRNLHIYANVDNPFVITNWTGLDPETDNLAFSYPNVRAYTLGLNITF